MAELEAQIRKLKKNNLGLVFEDKHETIVDKCKSQVPVLREVVKNCIALGDDLTNNLLIEGDNYHSLSVLNYTHKKSIDLIYIDPPYNRGGDFIYNDQRIDKEDAYRHSKWLSFMRNRLILARDLLSPTGVMFISIDDNEQSHLRILCDKIFGEDNVEQMIWKRSGFGRDGKMKNTATFRIDHEYIIVCYKDKKLNKLLEKPDFQNTYPNPDNDPRGPYKAGSISRREDASNLEHENYYKVTSPSGKAFTRQFDIPEEEFQQLDQDGRIYWGKNNDAVPAIKIFIGEERSITPYSVLLNKGTTTEGTKEASAIIGIDCTAMRPKPSVLIKTLIQLGMKKDDGIVLDFFAGTGTTGQAVLEYNKKYNKNCRFILATTNDEKEPIADMYTLPRMVKIAHGYDKAKGLPCNLYYYQTDLIDIEQIHKVSDNSKICIAYQAGEMIAVREDTLDEVEKNDWWQIFESKGKLTAIYFKEDKAKLAELIAKLDKKNLPTALYIFSWGKNEYKGEYSTANIRVEDIPEPIIEVYKELNRI